MPSIMRERSSIPAHRMMDSEFSRGSPEQPDLFSPLRDPFNLTQCRLDRITKLPPGSLSRLVCTSGRIWSIICAIPFSCESASKERPARFRQGISAMQITIRTLGNKKSRSLFGEIWPVVALLPAASLLFTGCRNPNAAAPPPPAEVEVAAVVQKDVPIYGEWVATLDGYVNAQIQPQVTGYITQQTYKEGSFVHKGQILFHIDPRPFQAVLEQANAQLAQAQAQLAKTAMDVDRDTPLAKERAIAQSQLDNDIQANRAAKAGVKAVEAQVEQAQLNLEFTEVKSLVDGMAGIAQVQIGNLVNPTTALTSVSKLSPIKAYFSISEQEYIHFADRINADAQKETPSNGPPFELILADGSVYPHKGTGLLANRQVDVSTGSIQIVCSF